MLREAVLFLVGMLLLRTTKTLGMSMKSQTSTIAAVAAASNSQAVIVKDLMILRHGQATHNPRAEAAKADGCSFDKFFDLMRQDDSLDSPLTELGRQQATSVHMAHRHSHLFQEVDLVVSSPLSRALETANLALPPPPKSSLSAAARATTRKRICYEGFREINGVLQNAKRRTVSQLRTAFTDWCFDELETEHDATWDADELESHEACRQRGYEGLQWLCMNRPERCILLVAHGGILRYTMEDHPKVIVRDGRRLTSTSSSKESSKEGQEEAAPRSVVARFDNCELRRYRVSWDDESQSVVLTEVDLEGHHNGDNEKREARENNDDPIVACVN